MENFIAMLRRAGQEPIVLGENIVVLPFGGRVLGVFPDGITNVLWVNPAWKNAASARQLIEGADWTNLGGDRTWISPEVETHVGDPARFAETYQVPPAIDPAHYQITARDALSVTLNTPIQARFLRSARTLELELRVTRSSLETPPFALPDGVSWAGYRSQIELRNRGELGASHPAIWSLLQVPGAGEMRVFTRGTAAPRTFIGEPIVEVEAGQISCRVPASSPFKFAVHASQSRGFIVYQGGGEDQSFLVVRRFDVVPDALYSDVPCDDARATGFMTQIYADDGGFGNFGEIEHHSPALQEGAPSVRDHSQTWAFCGSRERLAEVNNLLRAQVAR